MLSLVNTRVPNLGLWPIVIQHALSLDEIR